MNTRCFAFALSAAIAGCSLFATTALADTNTLPTNTEAVSIQIGSQLVTFPDAKPFIDANDRTQVPIRFVSEALGYLVDWQTKGSEVQVTLKNGSDSIELQTNDNTAYRNGQAVQMDTKALLYQDRTFVPLRFVAEAFHANVQWDAGSHTVQVSNGGVASVESIHTPATSSKQQTVQNIASHPQQSTQSHDQAILAFARQFLGTPYVFGGTGTSGFDCSGYVQYVFAHNGINLPRTAAQMYTVGTKVTDLLPGDLVFFTTYQPGASHVGIYLGNQQFISATSSHGVSISTLENPYWAPRYLGAKRL